MKQNSVRKEHKKAANTHFAQKPTLSNIVEVIKGSSPISQSSNNTLGRFVAIGRLRTFDLAGNLVVCKLANVLRCEDNRPPGALQGVAVLVVIFGVAVEGIKIDVDDGLPGCAAKNESSGTR